MKNKKDIPAFPEREKVWTPDGESWREQFNPGMTLRDYFAAKAMQTMIGMISRDTTASEISQIPKSSYSYADDMIEERDK